MTDQASETDRKPDHHVVSKARDWIGTPYRHQASCKGAGTDCLGLLRGLWREIIGEEPVDIPAYSPDWSETGDEEVLLDAATLHLKPVARQHAVEGDILVLRMRNNAIAKHVGVLAASQAGYPTMIHAYSGQGVTESPLTDSWMRNLAGVFCFPYRSN
ncbi:NlpC/P60 family protein [Amaricoccus tamworthensis]|uniref:NlpC/P60 family protein n=1 Tax=Amaricoccus tamworthensis TaxID=57002 RepID=UPI003C7CE97F